MREAKPVDFHTFPFFPLALSFLGSYFYDSGLINIGLGSAS